MRMKKIQKESLLQWIAEGLKPAEINKRAAREAEPFKVTRQQIDYYRQKHGVDIGAITEQADFQALNTGLALRDERVQALKDLAVTMLKDLNAGKLWLSRQRSVGSGKNFMQFMEDEFNKAEVDALRGLLDDIAREVGARSIKTDISTDADGEYVIHFISEVTKEVDEA